MTPEMWLIATLFGLLIGIPLMVYSSMKKPKEGPPIDPMKIITKDQQPDYYWAELKYQKYTPNKENAGRILIQDHDQIEPDIIKGILERLTKDLGTYANTIQFEYPNLNLTIERIRDLQGKIYLLNQYLKNEPNSMDIREYEEYLHKDEWKYNEDIKLPDIPTNDRQPLPMRPNVKSIISQRRNP